MIRSLCLLVPGMLLATAACGGDLLPRTDPAAFVTPTCESPAPLLRTPDPRAPGYIVVFKDGTDVDRAVAELAGRYGFRTKYVYRGGPLGFAAEMTGAQVAGVRCASTVRYVDHDAVMWFGAK